MKKNNEYHIWGLNHVRIIVSQPKKIKLQITIDHRLLLVNNISHKIGSQCLLNCFAAEWNRMHAKSCSEDCNRFSLFLTLSLKDFRHAMISLVKVISVKMEPKEKNIIHALRNTKYQVITYWNEMAPKYPFNVFQSNGNLKIWNQNERIENIIN